MNEEQFRKLVREVINEVMNSVDEISTTAGVAGYEVPHAFTSGSDDSDEEDDDIVRKKIKVDEARTRYHRLKNDQSRTAKQKIGQSIRDAKKAIREARRTIRVIAKYKNEFGYSMESYWKTTQKDIYRMEEDLKLISQKLRELRS